MQQVSFAHTIVPTPISPSYRAGLIVVAAAMLLLPAIYLALIAGTIFLVYLHLTADSWILTSGGASWVKLVAYFAPAFAGLVLAFFLVKPVLAPRRRRAAPVLLERGDQPALFAFIDEICRQVRAPLPVRVQVDCKVNASAAFAGGPLSVLRRELVLTIGLPLAAGLSVRELGGVLAHEFGHFAQGGGMGLTWVVRSLNAWFFRVVYERDRWDDELERSAGTADFRAAIFLHLARGCVWVSRRALSGLMMAGHVISCFLMRQMEYDADSYEIKVAGSAAFARTMTRLIDLNAAMQLSYHELSRGRILPANLPAYFLETTGRVPADVHHQIAESHRESTRAFDTHPSDVDRIRVAEQAGAAGAIVGGDEPAASLFEQFDDLSVSATRHHYEHDLNIAIESTRLGTSEELARDGDERRERASAIARFFKECCGVRRPLLLPLHDVGALTLDELESRLRDARQAFGDPGSEQADAYRRFDWLGMRMDKAFCAEELWQAGLKVVTPDQFELASGTLEDAQSTHAWAAAEQHALLPTLDRLDAAASMRLACCLRLAEIRAIGTDVGAMTAAFQAVAGALPLAFEMVRFVNAQRILAAGAPAAVNMPTAPARIAALDRRIADMVTKLCGHLGDTRYPLADLTEPATLAAWCGFTSDAPAVEAADVAQRLMSLYFNLLGRLVVVAEAVESAGS
ncbi:MAG TPA: M48 family metalloprotease [Vicinamibacterales bacterium]|jgi:Zn-dependent protease with chaperone function